MISYILYYLIVGTLVGFSLESLIRFFANDEVNMFERIFMILFWPLICIIFVYYFVKTFFNL
jgi:hypothetical protein